MRGGARIGAALALGALAGCSPVLVPVVAPVPVILPAPPPPAPPAGAALEPVALRGPRAVRIARPAEVVTREARAAPGVGGAR